MKTAAAHLATLDAGRDHKAYAAFKRLVDETEAPVHSADLRPILDWISSSLDEFNARLAKLEQRQDANKHNPERPDPPPARDPEPE